ncbi:MAG TPA: Sua5/YciO/YrdC/YwlC family protein, partial [Solirubrobacteraceae bacterium]
PFAVMARDVATAAALADLGPAALASLTSPARPIVLARRATGAHAVSALVAPGNPDLGVMLPYTALHHLLLAPVPGEDPAPPAAIVATSGNRSGEPLCTRDEEALERLRDLADAFLVHDREIEIPCDDSVVRVIGEVERPVRRSRGYAPLPLRVPVALPPTLAVGGELKATFCLADGTHAWMSQHIGDLENLETLDALDRSVEAFEAMYRIEPRVIAADLHPAYLSRRWARARRGGAAVVEVQHHHAHAASLMAEHGLDGAEPIVALVFDGTGYGPAVGGGAAAWGGELLVADYDGFERAGRLAELPLPGGDAGVRNPCRTALAYLAACGLPVGDALPPACAADAVERRIVTRQVQTGTGVVPTTSMGRLFDVVASLLDVRQRVSYEGQAAIELEALAATAAAPAGELRLGAGADGVLDPAPLLAGLLAGLDAGAPRAALALGFHAAVSEAAAGLAAAIAAARGLRTAGLTGGVFQNALLARRCRAALEARGLDVLEHRIVPTNDGGLALGQAVIAGRRAARAPIRR